MIFKQLQSGARVSIWLFDNTEQRIEGKIIVSHHPTHSHCKHSTRTGLFPSHQGQSARVGAGSSSWARFKRASQFKPAQLCLLVQGFDEFMNVVMDDAEEVWVKETKSKKLGSRNHLGTPPPSLAHYSPRRARADPR